MPELLLAAALGVGIGVLAGLYGVGGGLLFVPLLVLLFDFGQVEAEATSLLAILPTVAAGAWQQQRYGNVRWRSALIIGLAAIAGVQAGVLLAQWLPEDVLRRFFGLLVLAVAGQLAWRSRILRT